MPSLSIMFNFGLKCVNRWVEIRYEPIAEVILTTISKKDCSETDICDLFITPSITQKKKHF